MGAAREASGGKEMSIVSALGSSTADFDRLRRYAGGCHTYSLAV